MPKKQPPETEPDEIPGNPVLPQENPDLIPADDPFKTPPAGIPEPAEVP